MKNIVLLILAALALYTVTSAMYVVDETQQVIITRFDKAVGGPVTTPGLKFKVPWIDKVNLFPKNLLEWDGQPGQVPTEDKTFIKVDSFGRWRIVDPLRFFEKVNNENSAHAKLDDIIDAAVRNLITSHDLIESVRNTNRVLGDLEQDESGGEARLPLKVEFGRSRMAKDVLEQARTKLSDFGIELVDVRFKRINYNERVLQDVYNRMIAERNQIAEKYRSEGRGESSKIMGQKEKELKRIDSEAYREAQTLKGAADGQATRTYASAYNRDPEFYSFVKTLEIYQNSLDSTTWAVLSTKSDFLRYLKAYAPSR